MSCQRVKRASMRPPPLFLFVLPLLGLFMLGASCNAEQEPAQGPDKAGAKEPELEQLPQVDTADLTVNERRTWVKLVNEFLSPCGEPVSVAKCVAESRPCQRCVPAARYVSRLVAEGFEKNEIQDMFADRYDPKRAVEIDVGEAPVRGTPMAPITIVEFSDFECPHCRAAQPVLAGIVEQFQGKVKLAFKHFPLEGHVNAVPAARAAFAAQQQGKFWQLADQIFEHQNDLDEEKLHALAREAGLDMDKFETDFTSDASRERVEHDRKDGDALKIDGTPALFVNKRPFNEPLPNLEKYLKEELGG
jgi:protein-disulfide isomerase